MYFYIYIITLYVNTFRASGPVCWPVYSVHSLVCDYMFLSVCTMYVSLQLFSLSKGAKWLSFHVSMYFCISIKLCSCLRVDVYVCVCVMYVALSCQK